MEEKEDPPVRTSTRNKHPHNVQNAGNEERKSDASRVMKIRKELLFFMRRAGASLLVTVRETAGPSEPVRLH